MKRLALAAAAALTLTACATTSQEAYYNAIAERERRQAEMQLRADTAIAQMAQSGDAQAKGMAIMYFAQRASQNQAGGQGIQAPRSTAEQLLPWASIFVPALTQVYGIQQSTKVQINNSNNSLAAQQNNNETMLGFGRLMVPPTIGTDDDVLLFPR